MLVPGHYYSLMLLLGSCLLAVEIQEINLNSGQYPYRDVALGRALILSDFHTFVLTNQIIGTKSAISNRAATF